MADHRMLAGSLPWYATGTLPEAERKEIETHLIQCDDCRQQLLDIQEFGSLSSDGSIGDALEHVAPSLLVQYAEAPQDLDPEIREGIELRLSQCEICRETLEHLQQLTPVEERSEAPGWWERFVLPLLQPAPALGYLAVAAIGWALLWLQPGETGRPLIPGQVVTLDGERSLRDSGSSAQQAAWTLLVSRTDPQPVLIELQTELDEADLETERIAFAVELQRNETVTWTEQRPAAAFLFRQGRAALPVLLDPGTMDAEIDYRISIRVLLPGDPLDGQILFTRKLRISRVP